MEISSGDKAILRTLAERAAEIAALPVHKEKRELWRRLNQLDSVRPMVSIYQVPWSEVLLTEEEALGLRCENPFCRGVEGQLRRMIFQWDHFPGDMVVEPVFRKDPVLAGDGFGLGVQEDTIDQRGGDAVESSVRSHSYIAQIKEMDDIEKIAIPDITLNEDATRAQTETLEEAFDGLLTVRTHIGFGRCNIAPWDRVVQWTGVEPILTDLALRPEYVHALMDRLTSAYEARLDQYEALDLLALNNTHETVGQGGLGYTDELPGEDYDPEHVRCHNLWGGGMAQIFSEVSPDMHREFALQYEARCLNRFALVYYGCCEPLDKKVEVSREMLPNLRKISMSPMADDTAAAKLVGDSLVYSSKPNPAFIATTAWQPELVREELRGILDVTAKQGCHVELILKDISTIRCDLRRLTEWSAIAVELSEEYAR